MDHGKAARRALMIAKAVHPHKELVTNPHAVLSNPSPVMGNPEPPVNRFEFHNAPLYQVPKNIGGSANNSSIEMANYIAGLLKSNRGHEITNEMMALADPDQLHHHYVSGNTGQSMPMNKSARMKRAKEMGYNVDKTYYHSGNENKSFSNKKGEIYATVDKKLAKAYQKDLNQKYILPLLSRHKNTIEGQDLIDMFNNDISSVDPNGMNIKYGWQALNPDHLQSVGGNREDASKLLSHLKNQGYDSAYFDTDFSPEGNAEPSSSRAFLYPETLRHADARFDPRLAHVNDLHAADGGEVDPAYTQADLSNTLKNIKDPNISMPSNLVDQEIAARGYEEGGEVPPPPMGHNNPPEEMQPEEVMQKYQNTGLQFPAQEASARLATKIKRNQAEANGKNVAGYPANERTTIKAPKAQEGQKQLPDFTTGNITYDDWVKRHEQILNHNEIHNAANWYKNVYSTFKQHYPDEEEARKNMRAWLVAQQNVSPAGAMNNVLMQKEQMARQIPEHLWESGGMPNPTEAARAVLKDQPIEQGVGQKISDFVDSAEGKPVRSWMGNHPHGGSPFVVDVHTARDTGMVDDELINHLSRLGYDPEQLSKLKVDLKGSLTEAAYENRARFGQGLTNELNKRKWMGRDDWTPAEVQAIGWMGMTKLTRNAEEDSESGLNRNLRRISYELDPGNGSPWASKYGDAISGLSNENRADLTNKMTASAMKHAANLAGIGYHTIVHGTGAWEQYQNPAAVTHALSTKTGADIAANALGYLLNQTEVWHNRAKPMTANPKGFGIDFIEKGTKNLANKKYLQNFWNKVMKADTTGLLRGFQPIQLPTGEVGIRSLIDKGGEKNKNKIEEALREGGSLRKMLEKLGPDIDVHGHEAEITKAKNDWKEDKNGQSYLARLGDLLGSDPSAHLNSVRSQLENELEGHLDRAYEKTGKTWRKETSPSAPQQVNSKPIKKKPAKPVKGSAGSFASGGHIVDQALRITSQFGNQLPSAVNLARSLIRRRP